MTHLLEKKFFSPETNNINSMKLPPFLQVKVSVVNFAGGSFCWNYATGTFYSNDADANIRCNYAFF